MLKKYSFNEQTDLRTLNLKHFTIKNVENDSKELIKKRVLMHFDNPASYSTIPHMCNALITFKISCYCGFTSCDAEKYISQSTIWLKSSRITSFDSSPDETLDPIKADNCTIDSVIRITDTVKIHRVSIGRLKDSICPHERSKLPDAPIAQHQAVDR
jgi:hypothetical protein